MKIVPVILCGGSGTRLWPLSRQLYPKQFLPISGEHSLLQDTALRLQGIEGLQAPLLVCNEEHRFIAAEQLRAIDQSAACIILEPVGRNTAPAATVAALDVKERFGADTIMLVLPADHAISNPAEFRARITAAAAAAKDGNVVTLGVKPDRPETGYGYIRAGAAINNDVSKVAEFVEKPNAELAQQYLDSGDYRWNSGMFVFTAEVWLQEISEHNPEILKACEAASADAAHDLDFLRLDKESFTACPDDSIDYAVMEHTQKAAILSLDVGWNDVGSWAAMADVLATDERGNVTQGDVVLEDSANCVVRAEHRLVTGVGLDGYVIVETSDAVMVLPADRAQDVKAIVNRLKAEKRTEPSMHRKVYRPWGAYEGIDASDRFQVKRITVNPGEKLSLQMHHHRAEHWIVVKGTARVTKGDEEFLMTEDQSTYIPLGVTHRLENPGAIPLELIEVQSGAYLGEDDIVRFEDVYGRSPA